MEALVIAVIAIVAILEKKYIDKRLTKIDSKLSEINSSLKKNLDNCFFEDEKTETDSLRRIVLEIRKKLYEAKY